MSQTRDPLEERDILKVLDALEDERVRVKIMNLIQPGLIWLSQQKGETTNADKAS